MNKVLSMLMLAVLIFATSCKKMDLEGLSMGASEKEVMEFIKDNNMKLLPDEGDDYIRAEGDFRLMGFRWNKLNCQIVDDKLVFIGMSRSLEGVSDMMLRYIDMDFEEKFGEMTASAKSQMRMFGSDKENKHGYKAAYKINKYGNEFYLMIVDEDAPKP